MSVTGRVILIGDTQVGKTSLVQNLLGGELNHGEKSTIGAVFHKHNCEYGGQKVTIEIWDTAGQERYRALGPIYYRTGHGAIAVFDLTRRETMNSVREWIQTFRENAENDAFVIIAANKCDLEPGISMTVEETTEFAASLGTQCIWTSAQSGMGVQDLFSAVCKELVERNVQCDDGAARIELAETARSEKKRCC